MFLQVACRTSWLGGIPYAAITKALKVLGGASCSRLYKQNQVQWYNDMAWAWKSLFNFVLESSVLAGNGQNGPNVQ